ncbi:MAG: hypothetical protein JWN38_1076 [Candidatus Saccharibacteria bacterium]|nr:hypothetical protein [Candidatus Saccharibacteria bacterium]
MYWVENPDWKTGNVAADVALTGIRKFPIRAHERLKRHFYDTSKVIAVNGETVVANNGQTVDKFMFRYPGTMATKLFETRVADEVAAVTSHLTGVALPTAVGIEPAKIFRRPTTSVDAVVQTQAKLDLDIHGALDLAEVRESAVAHADQTARGIEALLHGAKMLVAEHGYYPDLSPHSGNVRRSALDGTITLIDVMPFYANGNRLIDDNPPNVIPGIEDTMRTYEAFVGQYGS